MFSFRMALVFVLTIWLTAGCEKFERGPSAPKGGETPNAEEATTPVATTPAIASSEKPLKVMGLEGTIPEKIMAGANHTCVTLKEKGIRCWGSNSAGQLGANKDPKSPHLPVKPNFGAKEIQFERLSAGNEQTCASDDKKPQNVYCWGSNLYSGLGYPQVSKPSTMIPPTKVQNLPAGYRVLKMRSRFHKTCVLLEKGPLDRVEYCWGVSDLEDDIDDYYDAHFDNQDIGAHKINWKTQPYDIAVFGKGICALLARVDNAGKKLGGGQLACKSDRMEPNIPKDKSYSFEKIEGGDDHGCTIVKQAGYRVACWGDNRWGQADPHTADGAKRAEQLTEVGVADKIAVGFSHNCVLVKKGVVKKNGAEIPSGEVYCWGNNSKQQSGGPEGMPVVGLPLAKPIELPAQATEIALGDEHSCAILADDTVWCWGDNEDGKLGNPTKAATKAAIEID
jgi:alpha-tubulin suppressor-like RCC1 family protein